MAFATYRDLWTELASRWLKPSDLLTLMRVSRLLRREAARALNRHNRAYARAHFPEFGWLKAAEAPGLGLLPPPKDRYEACVFRFEPLYYSDDRPVEWCMLLRKLAGFAYCADSEEDLAHLVRELFGLRQGQLFLYRFTQEFDDQLWARVTLFDAATGALKMRAAPGAQFLRRGVHSKKARQVTRWNHDLYCSFQFPGCTYEKHLERCSTCKLYQYCTNCADRLASESPRCSRCGRLSPCCDEVRCCE